MFLCNSNRIDTLVGGPDSVTSNFNCAENDLVNVKGIPAKIGGNLLIDKTIDLTEEVIRKETTIKGQIKFI
jgi:hypothetical protein